jgi:Spy/CpxP family protein refolding chaperone
MLGPMGRGGGPGLALGALNLSEAQREQVREITRRYREQNQAVEKRLGDAMAKQRTAIETVPANEALITSLTQDLVQAQVDVAIAQARLNTEIWSVLTPEQQAEAAKMRAERQARMEERRKEMEQRRAR